MVYATPASIGKYGGDEDNFEWPLHTGDWGFLRAYVGKDGKPAPYSKDNVPFQPESWLTVSQEPLEAGDYVMVTGYPGRTNRYRLADEVNDSIEWEYPMLVDYLGDYLATIDRTTQGDKAAALKYASTIARSEEHTSELQSLMRISYAVFCLKKKKTHRNKQN